MYVNQLKIDELLVDESFIKWIKNPDEQTTVFWEQWCLMHPEYEKEVSIARNIVSGITYEKTYELTKYESDTMLANILQFERQMRIPEASEDKENNNILRFRPSIWVAAASIVILIGSGVSWWMWSIRDLQELTSKIQQKKVRLPDGSVVTMNSQSKLIYPARFWGKRREVKLEGEAFFEVKKDAEHPFIIHTNHTETTVLGTSFNVRARKNEYSVAVMTGKVQFRSKQQKAILLPGEIGMAENTIRKTSFNPKKVIGWKDGILLFEQDNFEYVFKTLEERYGVHIVVAPNTLLKGRYSGEFKNESLENVLTGIAFTSRFQFRIDKDKVIISN
ncbi:FecR family protein [Xanthocytophaga flava]|uniref:FecR family protein n=1 Tax=Xanthocytophaga flava TaxID=3048013 RepID=UPI0028D81BA9|nr:FecR domain-containing protein [Xanthocytophaga flavus]MDJ1469400.1 FecR domain-containing protein [Xanthocytophaga flavus]